LNVLQGGKFGHGFISAGFTKFAITNWIDQIGSDDWDGILGRTAIASVTGGTVSELTGGKFANGAQTAAFAHLFNQESGRIAQIVARAEQALADDEPYGINDKSGLFGPGTYKCNKFVCDVSNAAGANIGLNVDEYGNSWPPLAGTFENPNVKIPGWEIVDSPQPGDIVAQQRGYGDASGHAGIIVDKSLNV